MTHPLIDKVLQYDTDNGERFSLSRFTADLGDGRFLMRRINPSTGEELPVSHIIHVSELTGLNPSCRARGGQGADIFDDYASFARFLGPAVDKPVPDSDRQTQ